MLERYFWYHAEDLLLASRGLIEGYLPGREGEAGSVLGKRRVAAMEESYKRGDETEFHMRERGVFGI